MKTSPAAEVLLAGVAEMVRAIEAAEVGGTDRITVCDPWTVRDVVAHCSGSMVRLIEDRSHRFTPEDNQGDVDERRSWPFSEVLAELTSAADPTADRIATGAGRLDGLGLGVWVHTGDVREALRVPEPFAGPGLALSLGLLEERSRRLNYSLDARVDDRDLTLGTGESRGSLATDAETFVRLTGGRNPDPARYQLEGAEPDELVLFG